MKHNKVKFKVGQSVVVLPGGVDVSKNPPKTNEIYTIENPDFKHYLLDSGVWVTLSELPRVAVNQIYLRPVTYISDSQFEELEKELNKEEYAKI